MTIRVLLADDQPLIRTALQIVITGTDDIEVAGGDRDRRRGGRPGPVRAASTPPRSVKIFSDERGGVRA
jgi:DNA-binding NarL/FixJ family response regulator